MKIWILLLVMVAGLFIFLTYLFVPSTANIVSVTGMKANQNAVIRAFASPNNWDTFTKGHCRLVQPLLNGAKIEITYDGKTYPSEVIVIPVSPDSSTTRWECKMEPAHNPFGRINAFFTAREIKSNLSATMTGPFKKYCENQLDTYGMNITIRSTTDTMLIATRFVSPEYPSVGEVYRHVAAMQKFASARHVRQISPPIFNATATDSNFYRCMVAIPIDKEITARGDIFYVRMVPGKFLSADVTGGPGRVREAHRMMQHYIQDYKKTIMAIPFEQFNTDRSLEKDSTGWHTRLFYPTP